MSAALFRRTLSLTLVLLAALGVAAEADKLKEVIMTKPIEGLREIVKAAEINLPKGADPDDVEVPFLPTQTQPTLPYPAQPCPPLPSPALPCPPLPSPAQPCPTLPSPAQPCPTLPKPAQPCPTLPNPALPCLP